MYVLPLCLDPPPGEPEHEHEERHKETVLENLTGSMESGYASETANFWQLSPHPRGRKRYHKAQFDSSSFINIQYIEHRQPLMLSFGLLGKHLPAAARLTAEAAPK